MHREHIRQLVLGMEAPVKLSVYSRLTPRRVRQIVRYLLSGATSGGQEFFRNRMLGYISGQDEIGFFKTRERDFKEIFRIDVGSDLFGGPINICYR